jgi:hypothetical protein
MVIAAGKPAEVKRLLISSAGGFLHAPWNYCCALLETAAIHQLSGAHVSQFV